MAFTIEEALDADIPRACEIQTAAYANYADGRTTPIFFPGPFPADGRGQQSNRIIEQRNNDPAIRLLKVVDKETGEQIAFAKWHIYETTEAAASAPPRSIPRGPGVNEEACEAFFGGLRDKKKELVGAKPHLYLHMVHTDPKYGGRGAGGALVKWGAQKADELGLFTYLESSPAAHEFYKKRGFKDVDELKVDLSKWAGVEFVHGAPLMIRDAVKNPA